jgi:hypothetical protein
MTAEGTVGAPTCLGCSDVVAEKLGHIKLNKTQNLLVILEHMSTLLCSRADSGAVGRVYVCTDLLYLNQSDLKDN